MGDIDRGLGDRMNRSDGGAIDMGDVNRSSGDRMNTSGERAIDMGGYQS